MASSMDQTLFTVNNCQITGKIAGVCTLSVLTLILLKKYFSGGVCRIKKDLTGKTAVITGGNAGIGEQTALSLAKLNCNIIIGARDKLKLEEVLKKIHAINPKIEASYHELDLGSKVSIEDFVSYVKQNCKNIDYLINNAGVMYIPQRRETKEGLQMQIGINHFGHFYLTHQLKDLLTKSQEFRVINVSSLGHFMSKGINFDDVQLKNSYSSDAAYYNSKLANIYFTKHLQKKIDGAGLKGKSVCLHPGVVRTELTRYLPSFLQILMKICYPLMWFFGKSSQEGAQTTLYTVLQDYEKLTPGGYYVDCAVKASSSISNDPQKAEKLWNISDQIWKVKFDL